ncbi:hypothetical protein JIN86_19585 [Lysinibacillus sp. HST-98]|uniref:hypothetical protein n=1 Tax=Lysinibacillus TaxID=400634 RepID=UPI0001DA5685|nr:MULTISPECIES: hypothetical protein [Lysinibacillus]EFI68756.1 hypothetical protein BFZC1_09320 [Lysinibacillus fusiformis ZC1]EKU42116.1 hypothetical protein C518_3070 [Lysinibacillus fusiformis ZB2]MBL3731777.1 hypothetical protein [Lysinibacillus sp. HST-98]
MDWLKECDVDLSTVDNGLNEFRITNIEHLEKIQRKYSILTEFYISLAATSPDSLTSIFIKESSIPDELLGNVVTHFEDVKLVTENNNPVEIMLKNPKRDSITYILNNNKNPIIENLFYLETENSLNEWTPRKTYKLEASKIEKYDNHEFDGLLTYLSPPTNQSFFMLPVYGWVLNDSLKDLFAIRYFTHKFKDVYLWVDENKNVTNIQLTEKQE